MQRANLSMIQKNANTDIVAAREQTARDALRRATGYLESLQNEDGSWEAEMVWNTMLLSEYVIVVHATGQAGTLSSRERAQMIKHFTIRQLADGSWPMHIDSNGYLFFTTLAYVSLRMLGVEKDAPMLARARAWIRERDVRSIPTWGKFWLSMLGLYEYVGMNPVPPELFLLPKGGPLHPDSIYCHTRYTYMAMAYLYGSRFVAALGSLRDDLRGELYAQPYQTIDFQSHREDIAEGDLHIRPGRALALGFRSLHLFERFVPRRLRSRAMAECLTRVEYEQKASRFRGLSPVNGLVNVLVLYASDPQHPLFHASLAAMRSWQWDDEAEGIRLCGARSTAWDTSLVLRALSEAWPTGAAARGPLGRGYAWLKQTQIKDELGGRDEQARDSVLGGFCFSAGDERWPVSDCTAEALLSMLTIHGSEMAPASRDRVRDEDARNAVEFILQRQNADGGFGTYERARTWLPLSALNPSEMYGDCMSERSFTECTASCIGALVGFLRSSVMAPPELTERVKKSIERAVQAISTMQRSDGSFQGSWGINFTFGTFHAIEALTMAGVSSQDPRVSAATAWLLSKQKPDGGWGEHWTSCAKGEYVEHPESQAAMTAWALLGLLRVLEPTHSAIVRGLSVLHGLQQADGSWPRQSPAGVFFVTSVLDYLYYKDYFPTWALARHARALRGPLD